MDEPEITVSDFLRIWNKASEFLNANFGRWFTPAQIGNAIKEGHLETFLVLDQQYYRNAIKRMTLTEGDACVCCSKYAYSIGGVGGDSLLETLERVKAGGRVMEHEKKAGSGVKLHQFM